MDGSDEDQDGVLLSAAGARYSEPDLWQNYLEADRQISRLLAQDAREYRAVRNMPHPTHEIRRLTVVRDRIGRQVAIALHRRLISGELVASGYVFPLPPDGVRVNIRVEHWRLLRPNFRKSTAEGGGLKFQCVRVRPAVQADAAEQIGTVDLLPEPIRPAGRPTVLREIKAELRRRAEAGELAPSLMLECRYLARWIERERPDHRYQPRSLKKSLGVLYRELKGDE